MINTGINFVSKINIHDECFDNKKLQMQDPYDYARPESIFDTIVVNTNINKKMRERQFQPITKEQLQEQKAEKKRVEQEKIKKEKRFLMLLVTNFKSYFFIKIQNFYRTSIIRRALRRQKLCMKGT